MIKDKKNILILVVVIIIIIIISYFMFSSGITTKLSASVSETSNTLTYDNVSNYPVIDLVINSSGEQYVNESVAITVNASSNYNIKKLEYSFDLKKWTIVKENIGKKSLRNKIVFDETMDEKVYIRVENEIGYKSYSYETVVKIDKEKPSLKITAEDNSILISAKDNVGLSSIQYSYDSMNWDEEEISGGEVMIRKENFNYKYIRVVDHVGNISNSKKIGD